jgi:transcriptional regulator with XRE-family HTH domain
MRESTMSKLTPFGLEMRKLRLEKQLRLLDLAKKLDVSAAYLSAIETGKKPIPDGLAAKIGRACDLTAEELAVLGKAKDRTRKEVRVAQHKEEDRELIAAFARQLDDVPPDLKDALRKLVMKSMVNEVPFERKRKGIVVPAVSTAKIRAYAEKLRSALVDDSQIEFPIIEVLEWTMPKLDAQFIFSVQDENEMGDNEGLVPVGEHELILRSDVYEGACNGSERDRFTACHELGHYLMHRKIKLARAMSDSDKIYCDSEWQADTFAATLLVSQRHANLFHDSRDLAAKCKISPRAGRVIWEKYLAEGIIASAPAFAGF